MTNAYFLSPWVLVLEGYNSLGAVEKECNGYEKVIHQNRIACGTNTGWNVESDFLSHICHHIQPAVVEAWALIPVDMW